MSPWTNFPCIYGKIPKTSSHLNTNAKATYTGARDPCFTVVKRSSNMVTARETLTTTLGRLPLRPSNVSETLARLALLQRTRCQRWASGDQLSPTFLKRWPALPELWWSISGRCWSGIFSTEQRSQYFVQLKTFGALVGPLAKCARCPSVYGVALMEGNVA